MKTCPHCAEPDLQDEAKICKHCGRSTAVLKSYNKPIGWGFLGVIFAIAGLFYWPLWILAALLFILQVIANR